MLRPGGGHGDRSGARLRLFVGVTDGDWFEFLARQRDLEEVNFWQPSGHQAFRALQPGELFLFKLHSPRNYIVGGGFFAHWTKLPVSLAWDCFGISNGASSLEEMRRRIEYYRRQPTSSREEYWIGCIVLEQPFFLSESRWIPVPPSWRPNIVRGRGYDPTQGEGLDLWNRVQAAVATEAPDAWPAMGRDTTEPRYGAPRIVEPRLGQGTFRVVVTDAYARQCAVTNERVLPVLQAAHIRPYARGGAHRVDNGLLLRSDFHALFDRGYVTVTPDLRLEVSRRIQADFENGRHYYQMHGSPVRPPSRSIDRPSSEILRWHNEEVYQG